MKKIFLSAISLWLLVSVPALAVNQLIFSDEFDDGVLDPAWEVSFKNDGNAVTTDWDYDESVSQPSWLTVRDVFGPTNEWGAWNIVELSRVIPALGDFNITMHISWESEALPLQFIQVLEVDVLDENGTAIIRGAGYNDSWGGDDSGTPASPSCCYAPGSLYLDGTADVEIDRTGNVFTFTFSTNYPTSASAYHTSSITTQDAEKVVLRFRGSDAELHNIGTLAIDHFAVEGAPIYTDGDGDGVLDADDNCPNDANLDQTDTDLDGDGDACDDDDDNDGICDANQAGTGCTAGPDNCPTNQNPDQADLDNDNIGDVCDGDVDGLIFSDEFDDGVLDPAWQVTLKGDDGSGAVTTGWDYDESVSQPSWLTVYDIFGPTDVFRGWNMVELSRMVPALEDFNITMHISWSAGGLPRNGIIQVLEVLVYDGDGTGIVRGGYNDSWGDNDTGSPLATGCCYAPGSLDLGGTADVELDRTGDVFTFNFSTNAPTSASAYHTGTISTLEAEEIVLRFRGNDYHSENIGTLAIDYIKVEGTPIDTDGDGDGVLDADDNCPNDANPDQTDTDLDGDGDVCDTDDDDDTVLDVNDNCQFTPNPNQSDIDTDGLGDVCDSDPDGDGIEAGDNCPLIPNPFQDDTDNDGQGDACDDDDDDTVLDVNDNCSLISNIDQRDQDGDGRGDVCDPDIDGDGVVNGDDLCPATPLDDLVDSNGCSLEQLTPCDGPRGTNQPWKNKGKYVSAVAHAANEFANQGLITEEEKGNIRLCSLSIQLRSELRKQSNPQDPALAGSCSNRSNENILLQPGRLSSVSTLHARHPELYRRPLTRMRLLLKMWI